MLAREAAFAAGGGGAGEETSVRNGQDDNNSRPSDVVKLFFLSSTQPGVRSIVLGEAA